MKVLLFNPSVKLESYGRFKNLLEPMPCIGIAYLAAVLEKEGHEVRVIDDFVFNLGIPEIIRQIKEFCPQLVGLSCLTPSYGYTKELALAIRKDSPDTFILMGNLHAEYYANKIVETREADAVAHGDAEETIVDLVSALEENVNLEKVPGLTILKDKKAFKTPKRELRKNLDELPYPAWHLFPYDKYGFFIGLGSDKDKPILSILTSRGCPFRCEFCSIVYSSGKFYRRRSPESIVNEILYLIDRYGVKMLGFMDSLFPLDKKHAVPILDAMIEAKIGEKITWLTETRVDCVDQEILLKMRKAGCTKVLYGLESGNQMLLDKVNKRIKLGQSKDAVAMARKAGIHTVGLFMIGLPGEDSEKTLETFKFACDLDLDYAKFSVLTPMPGSKMFDEYKREGKLRHENWDNYTTFNPDPENFVYCPEETTPEKLIKLQKKGLRQFYFRPKMVWRHLFQIRSLGPREILSGLVDVF